MKRKTTSAAAFMAELNADPVYEERRYAQEQAQAARDRAVAEIARPLLRELAIAGAPVTALHELPARYAPLPSSIVRVLLDWLPRIPDAHVQEQMIRALAAAKDPFAGTVLVELFDASQIELLRWAIANTIAEARPTGIAAWVAQALVDKRNGKAREMLALASARLLDRARATLLLQSMLDELPLHAAKALGEVGDEAVARVLEERLRKAKGVQRKELEHAIRKIRRKR
jgi:hypothetical protein